MSRNFGTWCSSRVKFCLLVLRDNLGSSGVITIWTTYILVAVAASGIVIAAGWRSRHTRGQAAEQHRYRVPNDPLWGDAEIDVSESDAPADVGGVIRLALKRMAPAMATQSMKVDVAAPSGLLGRMRGAVLADLLEELLTDAIHGAPGGRLLLTAAHHGDRIHVGVTDDVPGADPAVRTARVRGLMERVALRGASLDIDVRPADGTTMTLRFAAAIEASQDDRAPPEPAKGAAPPLIPFI
jgi:hypothetical protein